MGQLFPTVGGLQVGAVVRFFGCSFLGAQGQVVVTRVAAEIARAVSAPSGHWYPGVLQLDPDRSQSGGWAFPTI